jgi:hypothetical protein
MGGTPRPTDQRRSYRPSSPRELRAAFSQAAFQNQHWTGTDVAAWMSQRLGCPVSYGLGWSYLVKLKHSHQRPRPQHALADPEEQETFKKSHVLADSTAHEQGYTKQGGPPRRTGLLL